MAEAIPLLIGAGDIQPHQSLDAWSELAETLLRNLRSPHSRRAYATSLRDFFAWFRRPPDQVTRKDIIAYRDELRAQDYTPATVNRHLAAIRVLYQAALDENLIAHNPAAGVKMLETSGEGSTPALSRREVQALLESIDRTTLPGLRDYALILLMVTTGIRRAEAARLQVGQLAQHQGHWTVRVTRKGGQGGYVKVRAEVYRAIRAWLDAAAIADGALWRSIRREGRKPRTRHVVAGPLSGDGIWKILQQRAKEAGIATSLTPHVLRATFITLALDAGAPLHKVQYAAGHADPRTTERYHRSKLNLDDNAVDYLKI
jgi:integrase/recombinase XerD